MKTDTNAQFPSIRTERQLEVFRQVVHFYHAVTSKAGHDNSVVASLFGQAGDGDIAIPCLQHK